MTPDKLKRLDRILSDALGLVPVQYGHRPRYKWAWSRELTFPIRNKDLDWVLQGGIWHPDADRNSYHDEPQLDGEDRWVVAKWKEPPSPTEWRRQFGQTTPYPGNGRYYATAIMCKVGEEPDEATTQEIAFRFKHEDEKPVAVVRAEWEEARRQKERAIDARADARLDEYFSEYGFHEIGKRGGDTSFGGVGPGERKSP